MLSVFKFNDSENKINEEIEVVKRGDEIWFKGFTIATILGYKDTDKAIRNHVKDSNKIIQEKLFKKFEPTLKLPETIGLKNSNTTTGMVFDPTKTAGSK